MSIGNTWQWLIDRCIEKQKSDFSFRWLPDSDGEPWVPYSIVAELVRQEERTIAQNVSEWRVPRHPAFAGLIKITSFKKVEQPNGKRGKGRAGV